MKKISDRLYIGLTILAFLVLNMLNRLVVTSKTFNIGMNLYKSDFLLTLNAFIGDLGFLIILLMLILLISRRKKTFILTISLTSILLSGLIFGLKIYAFYYGTAFSFFNARTFSNTAPVLGQQLTIHLWQNLFAMGQYVAAIPGLIFIYWIFHTLISKRFKNSPYFEKNHIVNLRYLNGLVVGLLFFGISQIGYQTSVQSTFYEDNNVPLLGVQTMGVYSYYVTDLISYTIGVEETKDESILDELDESMLQYVESKEVSCPLNYLNIETCNNSATASLFEGKSIVLMQLESFNDYLIDLSIDVEGISYEVTPFFNQLAKNSNTIYYNNFYANNGVGKTSDAEFAALTGLSPTGQIVSYYDYVSDSIEAVPELFNEAGYTSYAITGSAFDFYRRNEIYPLFGIDPDHIDNQQTLEEKGYYDPLVDTINGWVDDQNVFDYLTYLLSLDEKQFIFTMSTIQHTPYFDFEGITGIQPWDNVLGKDLANYLDYAARFDHVFEAFYNNLETLGLLDDVVFVMYGDHTAGLTPNDLAPLFGELNQLEYQKLSHNVSFFITAPSMDLTPYQTNTNLVRGQTDIKRTLANLFGLNETYHFGVDILSSDATWTYNPMTLDLFTDLFHIILTDESIDNLDFETEMRQYIDNFYVMKNLNDSLLKYQFFDMEQPE